MHYENVESYQLYNTNTPTFFSRALELGCDVDFIGTAQDSLEDIHLHIKSALDSDLIITSGGVSVGEADYTKEAFAKFGYEILFDKIDIKPGKPTTFGKIGDTLVLNLPGNPLAAALNFELFAQSIILALSGNKSKYLNTIDSKLKSDFKLKRGRRTLVPGFFDGTSFEPHNKIAPGMISPLATSNSYIIIDKDCSLLAEGSSVKVIPTRFTFNSEEIVDLVSGNTM
jgi:molybdopterin molybdotransferase